MAIIEIKQVYKEIWLSDYAQEYGDQVIRVHVNPARAVLLKLQELRLLVDDGQLNEETVHEFVGLISDLWEGWSADDVRDLFNGSYETDPQLFQWLVYRSMIFVLQHRAGVKKN